MIPNWITKPARTRPTHSKRFAIPISLRNPVAPGSNARSKYRCFRNIQLSHDLLPNGGLDAIRKFYVSSLGIDILAQGQNLSHLEELHERRHIYVHRAGYVDEQYCHRFPLSGATPGRLLPVDEGYLLNAIDAVYASGLHIRNAADAKFPMPPKWQYIYGDRHLTSDVALLVMASAQAVSEGSVVKLTDLTTPLPGGALLRNLLVWAATDGIHLRWLIAGSAAELKIVLKYLHFEQKAGEIVELQSWKLNRAHNEPAPQHPPSPDLQNIPLHQVQEPGDEMPDNASIPNGEWDD